MVSSGVDGSMLNDRVQCMQAGDLENVVVGCLEVLVNIRNNNESR